MRYLLNLWLIGIVTGSLTILLLLLRTKIHWLITAIRYGPTIANYIYIFNGTVFRGYRGDRNHVSRILVETKVRIVDQYEISDFKARRVWSSGCNLFNTNLYMCIKCEFQTLDKYLVSRRKVNLQELPSRHSIIQGQYRFIVSSVPGEILIHVPLELYDIFNKELNISRSAEDKNSNMVSILLQLE